MKRWVTAVLEREGDGFVALCPELDIASQGQTVAEARSNLQEALELFLESAWEEELEEHPDGDCQRTGRPRRFAVAGTCLPPR